MIRSPIMSLPVLDMPTDPLLWLVTLVALASTAVLVLLRRSRPSISISIPAARPQTAPKPRPARTHNATANSNEIYVSKILVHPIKSCRGMSVTKSRYTPAGLENDRKWSILDPQKHVILTAREMPKMVLIEPRLEYDPTSLEGGRLVVDVPNGSHEFISFSVPVEPSPETLAKWPIVDGITLFAEKVDGYLCGTEPPSPGELSPDQILSDFLGKEVHFMTKGPAPRPCEPTLAFPKLDAKVEYQDGYPLLVASEESLKAVGEAIRNAASIGPDQPGKIGGMDREEWKDGDIPIERFRPNIVVKGASTPFAEDTWQKVAIGPKHDTRTRQKETMLVTLVSKCARCLLPNVHPQTGVRDAAVPYKVLMKFRTGVDPANMNKPCFGCNGVPEGEGLVMVGDLVKVLEWTPDSEA